jgi:hypothetical protein
MNKSKIAYGVGVIALILVGSTFGQSQGTLTSPLPDPSQTAEISMGSMKLEFPGDRPLHFIDIDGNDVLVQPGLYDVRLRGGDTIILSDDESRVVAIQGQPTRHEQRLSEPTLLGEQTTADEVHLLVLMPAGDAVDAVGTYSGIRQRATRPSVFSTTQITTMMQTKSLSTQLSGTSTIGTHAQVKLYQPPDEMPCGDVNLRAATVIRNNRPTQYTAGLGGFAYYGSISRSGNTWNVKIPSGAFDVQGRGYLNRFSFHSETNVLDVFHGGLKYLTGEQAWNAGYVKGRRDNRVVYYPTCFIRISAATRGDIGSEREHSTFYRSFTDDWPANVGRNETYSFELWYFKMDSGPTKYGDYMITYRDCQPDPDGRRCL